MKRKALISLFLVVVLCTVLSACKNNGAEEALWSEAVYTENTELGKGEKTFYLDVTAQDKTVTFTIHSDKEKLGEALKENRLIEGEKGAYGLYVKKVNGIKADYDENKAYWGLNKNGESMMTGVDGAEFKSGDRFEFIYTK